MQALVKADIRLTPLRLIRPAFRNTSRADNRTYAEVALHYDLPVGLFQRFTFDLTYSAAFMRANPGSIAESTRMTYQTVLQRADLRPRTTVLDLGSGWGAFARYIQNATPLHYVGVTISPGQIAWCASKQFDPGRIHFVEGNLCDSRTWPRQAGLITMFESIEHIRSRDRPLLFRELRMRYPSTSIVLQFTAREGNLAQARNLSRSVATDLIFTGPSQFPPLRQVLKETRSAGYKVSHIDDLTAEYSHMALSWYHRFATHESADDHLDPAIGRLWTIYLAATASALGQRALTNYHVVLDPTTKGLK